VLKIAVISACYEKPNLAAVLIESCKLYGLPLIMCGEGTWVHNYRISKIAAVARRVRAEDIQGKYDYILWTDGFDSFVCGSQRQISMDIRELDYPMMVLSAEKNCWPDPDMSTRYPVMDGCGPWRYINAGGWLAQSAWVLRKLEALAEADEDDDQRLWTRAYGTGMLHGAVIDCTCKIFQTMWQTTPREVDVTESGNVRNFVIPSLPKVVHFNGGVWRNPEGASYARFLEMWARISAAERVKARR
jgi:hypothetical protein